MVIRDKQIDRLIISKPKEESLWICVEESSELTKEVSKFQRGDWSRREEMLDEIADNYISLKILEKIRGYTPEEIQEAIDRKMKRNLDRIK